jgi:hypothetical protein
MENPLSIIRKNLPKVLNNTHSMIVSFIGTPDDYYIRSKRQKIKTPKLVCYYIYNNIKDNFIDIKREIYNINKKKPDEKYEIVGDFSVVDQLYNYKGLRIIQGDKSRENEYIAKLLIFLDQNITMIDTICIIKNPDHEEIDILYDTGYLNVAKRWLEIHKSWMDLKKQAQFEGNPERLKAQGYFNEIEEPGAFKIKDSSAFKFGKKSKSISSVEDDIRYLLK